MKRPSSMISEILGYARGMALRISLPLLAFSVIREWRESGFRTRGLRLGVLPIIFLVMLLGGVGLVKGMPGESDLIGRDGSPLVERLAKLLGGDQLAGEAASRYRPV